MDDLATWIARALYYQQPTPDAKLDVELAETMEELRGIDGKTSRGEG